MPHPVRSDDASIPSPNPPASASRKYATKAVTARGTLAEMCLTGEPITAQQALAIGLINYVSDPAGLDAKLDWLLSRLLDKSPAAIRRGVYTMKKIENMAFEEVMSFTESQIALFTLTEDAKEGQNAFQEKRKPQWLGR